LFSILASIARLTSNSSILPKFIFFVLIISLLLIFIPALIDYLTKKKFLLSNSIISACIFFLIVDPTQNVIITIIACILLLLVRFFFRYKNVPFLNPVVTSLSLLSLFFTYFTLKNFSDSVFISWWGTSFWQLIDNYRLTVAGLLIIGFGAFITWKLNRWRIVLFTLLFLLICWLFHFAFLVNIRDFKENISQLFELLLGGTLAFGIFFMEVEPKSSPGKKADQIFYALFFSLVFTTMYFYNLENSLLYSLFATTIFFAAVKYIPILYSQKSK